VDIILLRTLILAIGWPFLIIGSIVLVAQSWEFFKKTKGTIFRKLVIPSALGWLITMYILGITATFYMFDVPRKGTLVVLPVFIIWFATFITLVFITKSWRKEAIRIKSFYERLKIKVRERTRELVSANEKLAEQIGELDHTSRLLIRRDFERQQIMNHLREIDESKSSFVSIAAHQIRAPLSAVKWSFNMLLSGDLGDLTEEQKAIVRHAAESMEHLIVLVGDLLNIAHIESGKIEYKYGNYAPAELVSQIADMIRPKAQEKKIICTVTTPADPIQANGDIDKLRLVVQNIAENAVTYTQEGGKISIVLRVRDAEHYEIAIQDNGMGIPQNQQHQLFEKFFRCANVIKRQIAGTGLGLYLAKRIVEAHGGTIEVTSQEHVGSTFTIVLPL
jgi:signal transduction histidine kinase